MSLQTRQIITGKLRGTVFTFEFAGDVLPMHRHTEADVHVTIVARGRLKIHGPVIGSTEYGEGAVLDWSAGVDHEFVALTDNARVVNIIKN
jgi:quercetin dioxygenase-like cupin family protein